MNGVLWAKCVRNVAKGRGGAEHAAGHLAETWSHRRSIGLRCSVVSFSGGLDQIALNDECAPLNGEVVARGLQRRAQIADQVALLQFVEMVLRSSGILPD